MEALHWEAGKMFPADILAYKPDDPERNFYVGEDYGTGRYGAICPDNYRIGTFATKEEAMVACEAWHAEKGWY